jgi:hypothetical protein
MGMYNVWRTKLLLFKHILLIKVLLKSPVGAEGHHVHLLLVRTNVTLTSIALTLIADPEALAANYDDTSTSEEGFRMDEEPLTKLGEEYREKMMSVLTPVQIEKGKKLTEEGKGLREEVGLKPAAH